MPSPWRRLFRLVLVLVLSPAIFAQDPPVNRVTVATYNLENYLVAPRGSRPTKPEISRNRICQALLALRPDVLALQEIGDAEALTDLTSRLADRGLVYAHRELVAGYDTNIVVAIISRFPFTARRSHPDEYFLLRGRRFRTTRGIVEVEVAPRPDYRFTLFAVHLKSRRESGVGFQEEIREQEALVVRRLIDRHLRSDRARNLVVLGDFNDYPGSRALRTILGRGATGLIDTRPAERNGDPRQAERAGYSPRNVAWTHFFGRDDLYSRVDYILISPGMSREWEPAETYVLAFDRWGEASDHRPLLASFRISDR